jgi:hypothetical protein
VPTDHPPLASPPATPHAEDVASPAARAPAAPVVASPHLAPAAAASSSPAAIALASLRGEADGDPATDAAFAAAAEAEAAAAAVAAAEAAARKGRGIFRWRRPASATASAAAGGAVATHRQVSPGGSAEGGERSGGALPAAVALGANPAAYPPPLACDAASTAAGVHRASNLLLVLACGDGTARRALAGGAGEATSTTATRPPAATLLALLSAPEGAPLVRRLLRAVRHLADDPAAADGLARAGGLGALVPHLDAPGGAGLDALSALGALIRGGGGGGGAAPSAGGPGGAGGSASAEPSAPPPPPAPAVVGRMVAAAAGGAVPALVACLHLAPPAIGLLPPADAARAVRARQLAAPLLCDMAGAGSAKLARAGLSAGLPAALMRLTADDPAWAPSAMGGLAAWLGAEGRGELGGGGGITRPLARALSTPGAAAALRSVVRSGAGGVDGRRAGAGVVPASPAELAAVLAPVSRLLAASPSVARAASTAVGPAPVVLRLLALPSPAEYRMAVALAEAEGGAGGAGSTSSAPRLPPAADAAVALPLLDLLSALYAADRAPRDFLARTGAGETLEVLARTRVIRAVSEDGGGGEEGVGGAGAEEVADAKGKAASVVVASPRSTRTGVTAGTGIPDIVIPPAVRRRAEAMLATFAANAVVG